MADAPVSREEIYRVAGILDREKIPFAFIGGVALSAWGIPRGTFDMDLAVSVDRVQVEGLLAALEKGGCVLDPAFSRGFRDRLAGMEKVHAHLPAGSTLMAVDVFLAGTPFLRSVLSRRRTIDLGRGPVPVCSAADLILFKLLADRPKDHVDIDNVLTVQGVPEKTYLEKWSKDLGMRDRLERLLRSRG